MKDFDKFNTADCQQVEELLMRQLFGELTANETQELNNHLTICAHCQSYRRRLTSFQQSINIKNSRSIRPNPAIRKRIIQKVKCLHPKRASFLQIMWQKMVGMLQYRIPVYQGFIGMAVSLLIFLAINYFSISAKHHPITSPESRAMGEVTATQLNVINSLEIIGQQKIGKSVNEDTLLTRFIVTTM
jgi:anti-sigma factor RsiW